MPKKKAENEKQLEPQIEPQILRPIVRKSRKEIAEVFPEKTKKGKLLEGVVDAALAETPKKDETRAHAESDAGLIEPDCDKTVTEQPVSTSGLLAHFPNGETREPTKEELVQMGRAIAERLFGNRNVEAEPVAAPGDRPKPKISGNHCRLCKSFAGNDPRGALWSDSGHCLTYNHVQSPVEPEHYCNRFVFDEGLRDAEPR